MVPVSSSSKLVLWSMFCTWHPLDSQVLAICMCPFLHDPFLWLAGWHHLDSHALHHISLSLVVNLDMFKVSLGNIIDTYVHKQEDMTVQGLDVLQPSFFQHFGFNQPINLTKQYIWSADGCLNLPQCPITVIHGFLLFLTYGSGSPGLDAFSKGTCLYMLPRLSACSVRSHL